jgi:hypothetical protein
MRVAGGYCSRPRKRERERERPFKSSPPHRKAGTVKGEIQI